MSPALRIMVLSTVLALGGCATANPKDPFEGFNRVMFNFNDMVDKAAVKPAAEAYSNLPSFVQSGVGNFFGNLGDAWIAVNNFLQGKVADGLSDVMRVAVNSTFGLGGLLDIGSEAGLPKHREDFGQTLGKWGIESGPYIVLPLLGPSTLRDTFALPLDMEGDPWHHVRPVRWRNFGIALRTVDQRAALLDASSLIEEAALDRYGFVRDAYLQRRRNMVYDGNPPTFAYEHDVGPTLTRDEEAGSGQTPAAETEPEQKAVVELEQSVDKEINSAAATKDAKQ